MEIGVEGGGVESLICVEEFRTPDLGGRGREVIDLTVDTLIVIE